MELLSKLRHLEEALKPSRPFELQTESHLKVSAVPRVKADTYVILGALLQTGWENPSLAMPMKDGVLLQWDFGKSGYLTFVCESAEPAADFVRIQSGLVHDPSP